MLSAPTLTLATNGDRSREALAPDASFAANSIAAERSPDCPAPNDRFVAEPMAAPGGQEGQSDHVDADKPGWNLAVIPFPTSGRGA
jgi:hypothetical protein